MSVPSAKRNGEAEFRTLNLNSLPETFNHRWQPKMSPSLKVVKDSYPCPLPQLDWKQGVCIVLKYLWCIKETNGRKTYLYWNTRTRTQARARAHTHKYTHAHAQTPHVHTHARTHTHTHTPHTHTHTHTRAWFREGGVKSANSNFTLKKILLGLFCYASTNRVRQINSEVKFAYASSVFVTSDCKWRQRHGHAHL